MGSQFDDKVDQIRNRFVQRTAGDLNRLQSLMALLETSDPGPAIDAIRRMGHSLAGAAGTFGYSDLAAAADAVEMEAAAVQRSGQSDMLALQECCKRLLSEVQFLVGPPAGEQHKP